jgi:hypothetical protein
MDPSPTLSVKSAYMVNGTNLCRDVFLSIFQLSREVVRNFFATLRSSGLRVPLLTDSARGSGSIGRTRARTDRAKDFITNMATLYALPCPDARGSKPPDRIVMMLPQILPKTIMYELYVGEESKRPPPLLKPLSANAFFHAWRKKLSVIKVATRITDYCETCSNLSQRSDGGSQVALEAHRKYAHQQRLNYKERIMNSKAEGSTTLCLTFDFAENVYLPFQHRQPSQRFFLTGLKFDIFGISIDTASAQVIYGLTEGHWPCEKTANTVCSMLFHFLKTDAFVRGSGIQPRILQLTSDNCAGQNKNRWIIWFLDFLTSIGMFDEIHLSFLVAGHTKNMCDARFALIKRKMRDTEALVPAHMHQIIATASPVMHGVKATEVNWCDWKAFLEQFYSLQVKGLSTFHFFCFKAAEPGVVFCSPSCDASAADVSRHSLLDRKPGMLDKLRAEKANIAPLPFEPFTPKRRAYIDKELLKRYFSQDNVKHLMDVFTSA